MAIAAREVRDSLLNLLSDILDGVSDGYRLHFIVINISRIQHLDLLLQTLCAKGNF